MKTDVRNDAITILNACPFGTEWLLSIRQVLLEMGMTETIKWGAPLYMWNGKNTIGLLGFKKHIALWFHHGASMADPDQKLINAQPDKTQIQRQWRITSPSDFDMRTLKKYIAEAKRIADSGTTPTHKKPRPLSIPEELESALQSDPNLSIAYNKLSGSCQREYCEYIHEAKQPTTRVRRVEKITPMILSGRGLHDKYK